MLRDELHRLKTVERPGVIEAIAEARAHGDLSENAEYDAAKERQGFIEGRIAELEGKLANAQIIDPTPLDADGRVVFGATVELEDSRTAQTVTYQIVGDDEADIKQGKISDQLADRARADRQVRRATSPKCRRRAAPRIRNPRVSYEWLCASRVAGGVRAWPRLVSWSAASLSACAWAAAHASSPSAGFSRQSDQDLADVLHRRAVEFVRRSGPAWRRLRRARCRGA